MTSEQLDKLEEIITHMERGITLSPPAAPGEFVTSEGSSCALGSIFVSLENDFQTVLTGVGISMGLGRYALSKLPALYEIWVPKPVMIGEYRGMNPNCPLAYAIIKLYDYMGWSREEVLNWLKRLQWLEKAKLGLSASRFTSV